MALIAAGALAVTAIVAIAVVPSLLRPPAPVEIAGPMAVTCIAADGVSESARTLEAGATPADAIALCTLAAGVEVQASEPTASPESLELQVDGQSAEEAVEPGSAPLTSGPQGQGLTQSRDAALVCFDGATITVILDDPQAVCSVDAIDVTTERSLP